MKAIAVVAAIAVVMIFLANIGMGARDLPARHQPPGGSLALHIDAGTGCHYLGLTWSGGLYPRLDDAGNHICSGLR